MYIGGGLVRLRESLPQLAESESKIATYILDNSLEAVNLTIQQLADRSQTSTTAVVRLWKSLGFDGYRDLLMRITADLQNGSSSSRYSELQFGDSFVSLLKRTETSYIDSVQNTLHLLKEHDIQSTADALMHAKRILLYGVGASGIAAMDFMTKLLRIGLPVHYYSDHHVATMTAALLSPGDVFIAISHSGNTTEVNEVAQIAHNHEATVVSVTSFGDTSLSRVANIKLFTSSTESQDRIGASSSRMTALLVCDIVFSLLVNKYREQLDHSLEPVNEVVKSHRITSV